TERGRDTGRGRSRLHAGSLMTQPVELLPFARLKSWQVQKLMPNSISLASKNISTLILSQ
uniref:Uncharacterized protein n=1 Tax=Canis lupus familiaris TaxID=9615 RepID=A0A8C0TCL5_CANLF